MTTRMPRGALGELEDPPRSAMGGRDVDLVDEAEPGEDGARLVDPLEVVGAPDDDRHGGALPHSGAHAATSAMTGSGRPMSAR
jgi:hypothetical protein